MGILVIRWENPQGEMGDYRWFSYGKDVPGIHHVDDPR